jgi:hydroxyethylthiazole kinase-like uncharacterized protein yjeF
MTKILNIQQIKACDEYTIAHEPIASVDLMERAAGCCVKYILKRDFVDPEFIIFCGKGNNGGDGLSIARQLVIRGFPVKVAIVNHTEHPSADFQTNLQRLQESKAEIIKEINSVSDLSFTSGDSSTIIIDALLGTGVNKPLQGVLKNAVEFINAQKLRVISIDMPSGLYADVPNDTSDTIVNASLVLSFQFPKLSFLMPQNASFVPEFEILNIELDRQFIETQETSAYYITKADLQPLLKQRSKFSHKGNFGHALLIAGSYGKMGAAVIAAKACLRSGAGLLTVHVPQKGTEIIQNSIPEAMVSIDANEKLSGALPNTDKYNAIGIGPGIGPETETENLVKQLLNFGSQRLVMDADSLNILSKNKTWLSFLPADAVLTPHVKEFDRLTKKHDDDFERLKSAREFAVKYNCILVLKSAFTQIAMPDGNVFFNPTGNAGLAKGGSGDALTGIILGLMARGYNAPQATLIGVYLHGLAADLCIKKTHPESLLISDVIDKLPKAFHKLYKV